MEIKKVFFCILFIVMSCIFKQVKKRYLWILNDYLVNCHKKKKEFKCSGL